MVTAPFRGGNKQNINGNFDEMGKNAHFSLFLVKFFSINKLQNTPFEFRLKKVSLLQHFLVINTLRWQESFLLSPSQHFPFLSTHSVWFSLNLSTDIVDEAKKCQVKSVQEHVYERSLKDDTSYPDKMYHLTAIRCYIFRRKLVYVISSSLFCSFPNFLYLCCVQLSIKWDMGKWEKQ